MQRTLPCFGGELETILETKSFTLIRFEKTKKTKKKTKRHALLLHLSLSVVFLLKGGQKLFLILIEVLIRWRNPME